MSTCPAGTVDVASAEHSHARPHTESVTSNPYAALFDENPHAGLPAREQEFRRKVDDCAVWVATHGRLPKWPDTPWGVWLATRRNEARTGRLSPERRAYLDQVLPGWDAPSDKSDEHFFAKADECAVWVAEHGRLPKRTDTPWGTWLLNRRQDARIGRLSPERRAYLDQVLPGWDAQRKGSDEHFFAKADECAVWVAEHGRLPKRTDKPWCRWVESRRQEARKGLMSPARRAYLDQVLPGWDAPDPKSDEHFFAKADECAVWVAEHGRLPKQSEKPWGPWVDSRRREDRAGRLSPERRAYLDERLHGWDTWRGRGGPNPRPTTQ